MMSRSDRPPPGRPRVLVIGAGYAGLLASLRAARSHAHVTLLDPASAWVERTRLHQLATGQKVPERSLEGLLGRRATVVRGKAVAIDLDAQRVTASDHTGQQRELEYDELVYALGSSGASGVPGVSTHAFTLDSPATARAFADRLATVEAGDRVVVVGGGLTGIEAASELAESHPALDVTLLTARALGARLGSEARGHVAGALSRLGVTVLDHSFAEEVTATHVLVQDRPQRLADVTLWAGGFSVPQLATDAGLDVSPSGRVLVEESLRSRSHPHVWAAGDSAAAAGPGARPVRQSAYTAMILGATAGENITRVLSGQPPKPLSFAYRNWAVTLGRHDGVVQALQPDGEPAAKVTSGRRAAREKELSDRLLGVGSVRLERWTRFFRWPAAPDVAQRGSVNRTRGETDELPASP